MYLSACLIAAGSTLLSESLFETCLLSRQELHAHLNGSISEITLRKLADHHEKKFGSLPEIKEAILKLSHTRTLDECFEIFGIIHKLSKDAEALRLVVHDVIKVCSG